MLQLFGVLLLVRLVVSVVGAPVEGLSWLTAVGLPLVAAGAGRLRRVPGSDRGASGVRGPLRAGPPARRIAATGTRPPDPEGGAMPFFDGSRGRIHHDAWLPDGDVRAVVVFSCWPSGPPTWRRRWWSPRRRPSPCPGWRP